MTTVVAIHQPNFFPWLGFFDKLARADRFAILDHAQLPQGDGSWTNRVRVLVGGEARWLTAPVARSGRGPQSIATARFSDALPWRDRATKTLRFAYARAPYFDDVMPVLASLLSNPEPGIAAFNVHAIETIARRCRIDASKMTATTSVGAEGSSTAMLADVVRKLGGRVYLYGGGASGYQDDDHLRREGVEPIPQNFAHPTYSQTGAPQFVPGLSIIDALMNLGWDGVASILESNAQGRVIA